MPPARVHHELIITQAIAVVNKALQEQFTIKILMTISTSVFILFTEKHSFHSLNSLKLSSFSRLPNLEITCIMVSKRNHTNVNNHMNMYLISNDKTMYYI